ncbi:MATE family efflux transporter [Desulfonatronum thiodismutans]|uniref:MATE family efflux transporter n=1 Tax=Desulfonatronum thiodismutans TaxID=159290 RepID=UPI000690CBB5|nr:MATE family efflux transporter [Desulfonatronum thiodismutans]
MSRINPILTGSVLTSFFRLWLPSLGGLMAMTSASIVDGIFIGNYVGATALAAVNLIIPFLGILFGITFMLSMGGTVRAGTYIGQGNATAAGAIFSKTLLAALVFVLLVTGLGLLLETSLLRALGGNEDVLPMMRTYFRIIMGFTWAHLLTVVMYFFVRVDGYPGLAALALILGSMTNLVLDYLFIVRFGWGIAGAAWATGISQALPFLVLCAYFLFPQRRLIFHLRQTKWRELFRSAFNGLSECINEISASIIALFLNWMFMTRFGVNGVAAITVVNYMMIVGLMMVFSLGDAGGVFISQNYGAGKVRRIRRFLLICLAVALLLASTCIWLLVFHPVPLVRAFLGPEDQDVIHLTVGLLGYFWPVFAVNGLNLVITSYLTALHLPLQSSIIALARSLVLPVMLLLTLFYAFPDIPFILAIPLAELITFVLAACFLARFFPNQALFGKLHAARPLAGEDAGQS